MEMETERKRTKNHMDVPLKATRQRKMQQKNCARVFFLQKNNNNNKRITKHSAHSQQAIALLFCPSSVVRFYHSALLFVHYSFFWPYFLSFSLYRIFRNRSESREKNNAHREYSHSDWKQWNAPKTIIFFICSLKHRMPNVNSGLHKCSWNWTQKKTRTH